MRLLSLFAAVFLISLAVSSSIYALSQAVPIYDQYLALYTLGSDQTAEHYFPGDQADVLPGTNITWFVNVYNHMGDVRLVRIQFILLNHTMIGPNQLNDTPSTREPFYEESRLLSSNETWVFPITWMILNATEIRAAKVIVANYTAINSIVFNGETESNNVEVEAAHGYNFRIVIELWVYDESSGAYSFNWNANGEQRSAWNQIWFNMTRISLIPT